MNKIKVYHMDPYIHYDGFALIAAETADEANEIISDYKNMIRIINPILLVFVMLMN